MRCETGIRTVLAMADRFHARQALCELMTARVEVVSVAFSGNEALSKVAATMPDLLLTDLVLPVWDGLELVRRVKELPVFTMPLTMLMTPVPMFPFEERALEMGVYKVLNRPFEGATIFDAWEAATTLNRLPRTNLSEARIRECLFGLGFSARLPGTQYLTRAIHLTSLDCRIAKSLSTLYEEIADFYDTEQDRVAHAMRRAIESAWSSGALDRQHALFGNTIDARRGKPTNGELIARIAELLRVKEI